jgi:hypothetical protein
MGVGNFQFSRDETERQKQMAFFKDIELDVKRARLLNEIHKLKRQRVLLERLNKVKQRRLLKNGFSLEQIKETSTIFDQDINDIEGEIGGLEEIVKDPKLIELNSKESEEPKLNAVGESEDKDFVELKPKRKVILDREWDKPKLSNSKFSFVTIQMMLF